MDEVSGRACALTFDSTVERGGSAVELLDGLSFTAEDLRRSRSRVSWDEFAIFLERCRDSLGGPEALTELAAEHVGQPWPALMRALARGVSSASALYAIGQWNGPANFTCTKANLRKLSAGRILQTVEILPGFRDSPEFFYGMLGIIRATPRLLGQNDAVVEMKLAPRRASYEITPPPSRSLWSRARRHMSRNAWLAGALEELRFQDAMLQESEQSNRHTATALAEKSRQLDGLNELGRRVAQHLTIDELATAVTKLLEEHFKVGGLVFWVLDAEGRRLEEVSRSGATGGTPSRRIELHAAGRRVGGLWLWEGDAGSWSTEDPRLDSLAPWIALAVDNARSFEALSRQTRRLEQEIEVRKRTEQQLFQAQKLEALGVLAGGIAHDFNNILTAIMGYAELAAERVGADEFLRGDLDEIRIAGDRGSALISQLLLFSRRQIQELRHVDVNRAIAGIERLLRRSLGETIEL
ncbi:MAG: histidine kinase dimerization/phospho-acceptor domain-containing protein, partial [Myxococcota bacterium]